MNNKQALNVTKGNLIIVTCALSSMTRTELRAVAHRLNIPRGKDKIDTLQNLADAITNGDARFTAMITIREKGTPGMKYVPAVFQKKLRTHKANKVLLRPRLEVSPR